MKQIAVILLALVMAASLVACDNAEELVSQVAGAVSGAVDGAAGAVASFLSGDVTGEIGKSYKTEWFTFSVDSIQIVEEYKGELPTAGYIEADEYVFLDVVVTEKNTWEAREEIPMSDSDFYLTVEGHEDIQVWSEDPWDDSMMPNQFYLNADEEVTYHLVFAVPKDAVSLNFVYVEIDENNTTHATFTIKHTL